MMSSGGGTGQLFIIVHLYHLFLWCHFTNFQGLSLSLKQPYGNKVKSSSSRESDPDIDQINTTANTLIFRLEVTLWSVSSNPAH